MLPALPAQWPPELLPPVCSLVSFEGVLSLVLLLSGVPLIMVFPVGMSIDKGQEAVSGTSSSGHFLLMLQNSRHGLFTAPEGSGTWENGT